MNPIQQHLASLDRAGRREYFKEYEKQRLRRPYQLVKLPMPDNFPQTVFVEQWQSRFFLATVWNTEEKLRITVNRCDMLDDGTWKPGITLEDLQAIRVLMGYGGYHAVVGLGEFTQNTYVIHLV